MRAKLTNLSEIALPVVPWKGNDAAEAITMLEPGQSVTVDDPEVGRVDIGNVPDLMEELGHALESAADALRFIMSAVRDWLSGQPSSPALQSDTISVRIQNDGDYGIRALAGSNVDEVNIAPSTTLTITAPGAQPGAGMYIQLRQLGM